MVTSQLRILLARLNVERAKRGLPALSLRHLAAESGVSLSVVSALHAGRSHRVDFATLDRLLTYFHRSLRVTMDDLLAWEPTPEGEMAAAVA
jgi:transcriptional regulator with XRE-family HTH domain